MQMQLICTDLLMVVGNDLAGQAAKDACLQDELELNSTRIAIKRTHIESSKQKIWDIYSDIHGVPLQISTSQPSKHRIQLKGGNIPARSPSGDI